MAEKSVRAERRNETRELILAAAERLFAEHGVFAVSNRQVGEAAGQANNFAVGYHFGTKADLVRAIVRKHVEPTEQLRLRCLAEVGGTCDIRGWVTCLVRPTTEHLNALGRPTWFARFSAQVMTDPTLSPIMIEESLTSPALQRIVDGLHGCLPALPPRVRAERYSMASHLIVHTCAERERALAEGTRASRSDWPDTANDLIDAIVGMLPAPVTSKE